MNRADIIALIRHAGVKRPKRRARRMLTPDTIRLRYFSAIRDGVLRDMRDLVRLRLVPKLRTWAANASELRGDAADDGDVSDEIDKLAHELAAKWTSQKFATTVQPFAQDTSRFSREQLAGVLKDQIGIDVIASEPNLGPLVAQWTSRNVALIKTVPGRFFPDIEKRLIDGLHSGERWEDLQRMLEERMGVSEANAVRIARDQVGKLFGQINEKRQKDLGVTGYVWRTVRDNRVRDLHEERDGQPFEWDDPPADTDDDGHPGEPIQCRCYAEPNMQGLFDEAWSTGELEQKPEPEEIAGEPEPLEVDPGLSGYEEEADERDREQAAAAAELERLREAALSQLSPDERKAYEKSEALARSLVKDPRAEIERLQAELEEARGNLLQVETEQREAQAAFDASKAEYDRLLHEVERLEATHGYGSPQARAAEQALADYQDGPKRAALLRRNLADESVWRVQNRIEGLAGGKMGPGAIAHAKASEQVAQLEADRKNFDEVTREGYGPVRGTAAKEVERDFPNVVRLLGGRLKVDELNEGTRAQLGQLDKLPPSMLVALKPHMGEIHLTKGSVRLGSRWTDLETYANKGKAWDSRTSWDQVGGVCGWNGGVGKLEVVTADWASAGDPLDNVVAHELMHAIDRVATDPKTGSRASETKPWKNLWEKFRKGKDSLPGYEPDDMRRGYFTNGETGHLEAFAEAHAVYLIPDMRADDLRTLREAYPEAAARGDSYLVTAARFGPKIADYVEKRVKGERWIKP